MFGLRDLFHSSERLSALPFREFVKRFERPIFLAAPGAPLISRARSRVQDARGGVRVECRLDAG